MRKSILALAVASLLSACGPASQAPSQQQVAAPATVSSVPQQSETERLNQWFETKYEEQLQQSPLQMTFLGRKDKYDQVDDTSIAAEDAQLAWLAATVTA